VHDRPALRGDPWAARGLRSVSDLTRSLRGLVVGAFSDVWVRGEVTNLRKVSSGHLYFTLKDAEAILPAVLFRSSAVRQRFELEDGLEVACGGAIDVYPPHGRYQLVVREVAPLGAGPLQLAFEQLRRRLDAEGLFDAARKVPLPSLPRRVCLVTAKTGAAVRDLVTVIHRRFSRVEIVLVAVRVQGVGAAEEIARGLAFADRHARADVIVVGRGGGSLEDLWAFNEEAVARAIAACRTPVVSAVGHEVDVTIADFAADVRAATPSVAGELVVRVLDDLLAALDRQETRLRHLLRARLEADRRRLGALADRPVLRDPLGLVVALRRRVDHAGERLAAASPRAALDRRRTRLEDLRVRLALASRNALSRAATAYESRRLQLEALSPLRVLDRGYSLTRVGPRLLKSVAQARAGDALVTELPDGVVESRVEAVRPGPAPAS
jgi:exodeoxyribonuclease VII large subunit